MKIGLGQYRDIMPLDHYKMPTTDRHLQYTTLKMYVEFAIRLD